MSFMPILIRSSRGDYQQLRVQRFQLTEKRITIHDQQSIILFTIFDRHSRAAVDRAWAIEAKLALTISTQVKQHQFHYYNSETN